MRWDDMFDDLAAQLERGLDEEAERARIDDERLRISRLAVRDRLLALAEGLGPRDALGLQLSGGRLVRFRPREAGKDWLLGELVGESGREREALVPLAGITALILDRADIARSLAPRAQPRPAALAERLGIGLALRDLARRRRHVVVWTAWGELAGTIDRVGRDHLDLAMHDAAAPRREREVASYRIVPLDEVRLVLIAPA